jgi:hypothetical protein
MLSRWFLTRFIFRTWRRSSETSVDFQRTTRRYIPEGNTLHNNCCEDLESCDTITENPTELEEAGFNSNYMRGNGVSEGRISLLLVQNLLGLCMKIRAHAFDLPPYISWYTYAVLGNYGFFFLCKKKKYCKYKKGLGNAHPAFCSTVLGNFGVHISHGLPSTDSSMNYITGRTIDISTLHALASWTYCLRVMLWVRVMGSR